MVPYKPLLLVHPETLSGVITTPAGLEVVRVDVEAEEHPCARRRAKEVRGARDLRTVDRVWPYELTTRGEGGGNISFVQI